jgi:hypothetical protein
MSHKELLWWASRLTRLGWAQRWMAVAVLVVLGLMWATPLGLKWLLVQQLQQALKREVVVQAVRVHPLSLSVNVQGVSIKNGHGGELAGWDHLTVRMSAQSLRKRAWVIEALTLQGPRVSVTHLGQGRYDFSDLLESPTPKHSAALPRFVLHKVAILNGRVQLEDRPHQRTHTVDNFNLTLPLVSSLAGDKGMTLQPELSATVNGATLHVGGSLQPLSQAPVGTLALTLDHLDLMGLQAYVPDTVPLRLVRGTLSADVKLQLAEATAGNTALMLSGTARLQDLALNDAHDQALVSFKTLALTLSKGDVLARDFVLSDVTLEDPTVMLRIARTGQFNWTAAWPPAESPTTGQNAPPLALQLDRFTVRGGVLDFADASVTPAVQARVTDVGAVVRGFSTRANPTPTEVVLNGHVGHAAPLEIKARLNPLAVRSDAEMQAKVHNLELPGFSGYARKYVGYAVDKGKFSIDAVYRLRDSQLRVEQHVLIDQLTLGERYASPDAKDLPVALGVSLLKRSNGQIEIDLPMAGSLDAPEFSFGALIWQTVGHVLTKVASAPLRFLGDLWGADAEGASQVNFASGSFALDDAATQKLALLARALKDKEALALEVRGVLDAEVLNSLAMSRSQAVERWLIDVGQVQPARVFLLAPRERTPDVPAGTGVSLSVR